MHTMQLKDLRMTKRMTKFHNYFKTSFMQFDQLFEKFK